MEHFSVSKDGKVGFGGHFASCSGGCVPGTVGLLKGTTGKSVVCPDHVAFSSFSVARPARLGISSAHHAGDHVALAYNNVNSFFAAVIVRCDTWAVQWGVENSACLANAQVTHLANLCANTVCGVATPTVSVAEGSQPQHIFIATRFDVPLATRKANKEWRQFLAPPRVVETGLEKEGVVSVAAFDKNSFLLLTRKGSLGIVKLNADALRAREERDAPFFEVERLSTKLRGISEKSHMVVYDDGTEAVYAAVYTQGGSEVQLVQFAEGSSKSTNGSRQPAVLDIPSDVPIDSLSFAGPFHLCLCSTRPDKNLQFCGLVPGSVGLEQMSFESLTLSHRPLRVLYNESDERLVVLSSSLPSSKFATSTEVQKLSSIIAASLDFSAGPVGQDAAATASWTSIANPFRHHGPSTSALGESDDDNDGEADVQVLKDAVGQNAGRWTPLTLCYALATNDASRKTDVAVFAVETAPFLHTRLIKQWHNATAGLKSVLATVSTRSYGAVALPWNPRHIRRALRLLSQTELSSLFHSIATAVAASERVSSPVMYSDVTTAAIEMALHAISLARQMGAVLESDDVKAVAVMLRACREGGHELLRYASRMELLMESCLQQRAMDRVLRRRSASDRADSGNDATVQGLENNFYGISAELQTERTLHTRYTSNTWAQHLASQESAYRDAGAEAVRLLSLVRRGNDNTENRGVSDWKRLGAAAHADPLLDQFEQALL